MKRKWITAMAGISPAVVLFGAGLYVGQRNMTYIEHAVTKIELHNMEMDYGKNVSLEHAKQILQTYDNAADRLIRHKGAISAAVEYLR